MTAVEWLYEQIKFTNKDTYNELYEQYQQALEMEKQQIKYAFHEGWVHGNNCIDKPSKEYYNETYKTNNQ